MNRWSNLHRIAVSLLGWGPQRHRRWENHSYTENWPRNTVSVWSIFWCDKLTTLGKSEQIELTRDENWTFWNEPLQLSPTTDTASVASLALKLLFPGRWQLGKMQGSGKLEWPDGRVYTGQFYNNQCFGLGRLEIPNTSVCEGQWRDGLQNGHGVTKWAGVSYEFPRRVEKVLVTDNLYRLRCDSDSLPSRQCESPTRPMTDH